MNRTLILVPALVLGVPAQAQANPQEAKEVESFMKEALAFAKANGRDAFLNEVTRPVGRFNVKTTNRLYLTVYDTTGKVIGHGKKTGEVGANQFMAKDKNGKLYIQERIEIAKKKGTGWLEEVRLNSATMQVQTKNIYVAFHDGMVICCGQYEK